MTQKSLLKIGDFAKICNTTKDTLLHYEKKGLLLPAYIAANGYRFYRIEQYFDLEVILMYKDAGVALNAIKNNIRKEKIDDYKSFLSRQIKRLEQEKDKINQKIKEINLIATLSAQFKQFNCENLFFENKAEFCVDLYQLDPDCGGSIETSVEFITKNLCNRQMTEIPQGEIILLNSAQQGKLQINYIFTLPHRNHQMQSKFSAGKYASMFHLGDSDSHNSAFKFFINKIYANKLKPISDVLMFDRFYFISSDEFIAKYSVLVSN